MKAKKPKDDFAAQLSRAFDLAIGRALKQVTRDLKRAIRRAFARHERRP